MSTGCEVTAVRVQSISLLVDQPSTDMMCVLMLLCCLGTQSVCSSQREASRGRLPAALSRVTVAIDPLLSGRSSRVEQLEMVVAFMQAARILAYQQQQQASGALQDSSRHHQQEQASTAMAVDEGADAAATAELRSLAKILHLDASRT